MNAQVFQQAARSARLILTLSCLTLSCPAGIVLNTADSGPGSLRRALSEAAAGETITFAPSLAGTAIRLTSGQLDITRSLALDASALSAPVTLDAGTAPDAQRVLSVAADAVVLLDSLVITGGRTVDASHEFVPEYFSRPDEEFEPGDGGGIHNAGSLTVRNCVIRGNATGRGGDLWVYGSPGGSGGGIHNSGNLTIEDSLITGNSTGPGGLGIGSWYKWAGDCSSYYCYFDDDDFELVGRGGSGGPGAGIHNTGVLHIKGSTISANTTGHGGDGVDGPDDIDYHGDIEYTSGMAGTFYIKDGEWVDADDYYDSHSRIREGGDGGPGGPGGGIFNEGDLIVEECTITGNTTGSGGVGASGLPGSGGHGAGLAQEDGSALLGTSTVASNTTAWGDKFGGSGSGIFIRGGHFHIRNATVADNRTGDGGFRGGSGAGVFHFNGRLILEQVTISNNTCGDGGRYPGGVGGLYTQSGKLKIQNSIIAGNRAGSGNPDYERWESDVDFMGGNLIGGDPRLATLGYHGGPTRTMPPLPGSPAIDKGAALPDNPAEDQRGRARPMGSGPDLGAVESGHPVGYDAWAASHLPDGSEAGFTNDANGDGTSNAYTYACGADCPPAIIRPGHDTGVLVSFGYRAEAQVDTVIKVLRSADLKTFTEVLRIEGGEPFVSDGCTLTGLPTRPVLWDGETLSGRAYYRIEVEQLAP